MTWLVTSQPRSRSKGRGMLARSCCPLKRCHQHLGWASHLNQLGVENASQAYLEACPIEILGARQFVNQD